MASEAIVLACLPELFPTADLPRPHFYDPDPEDVAHFSEELAKAYRYAPAREVLAQEVQEGTTGSG